MMMTMVSDGEYVGSENEDLDGDDDDEDEEEEDDDDDVANREG